MTFQLFQELTLCCFFKKGKIEFRIAFDWKVAVATETNLDVPAGEKRGGNGKHSTWWPSNWLKGRRSVEMPHTAIKIPDGTIELSFNLQCWSR